MSLILTISFHIAELSPHIKHSSSFSLISQPPFGYSLLQASKYSTSTICCCFQVAARATSITLASFTSTSAPLSVDSPNSLLFLTCSTIITFSQQLSLGYSSEPINFAHSAVFQPRLRPSAGLAYLAKASAVAIMSYLAIEGPRFIYLLLPS